jgi:hypothetical protein
VTRAPFTCIFLHGRGLLNRRSVICPVSDLPSFRTSTSNPVFEELWDATCSMSRLYGQVTKGVLRTYIGIARSAVVHAGWRHVDCSGCKLLERTRLHANSQKATSVCARHLRYYGARARLWVTSTLHRRSNCARNEVRSYTAKLRRPGLRNVLCCPARSSQ